MTSDQGATAVARVVARDTRNDLALLQTGLATRKAAAFRTSIRLGEAVEAFGYPLTEVLLKSGSFTLGNVSALVGLGEDSRYLQVSAPVQPGNSGGRLLDQNGNLVGIVSTKLNALKLVVATNGDIAQNVNFAIKSSIVASFLEANGVGYVTGAAAQPMQPADLAEQAKGVGVYESASRPDKASNLMTRIDASRCATSGLACPSQVRLMAAFSGPPAFPVGPQRPSRIEVPVAKLSLNGGYLRRAAG